MPDSQTLGLLIAAMVAGVICFRLYTVLGRRTGHEPPPPAACRRPDRRAPCRSRRRTAAPSSNGLLDIQLADRGFDTPKFLAGARDAYAQIVNAFAAGDRAALRPLLSPDVYAAFDAGITARTGAGRRTWSKLHDARIVGAALHGTQRGNHRRLHRRISRRRGSTVTDVWTFERNLDSPRSQLDAGGDLGRCCRK